MRIDEKVFQFERVVTWKRSREPDDAIVICCDACVSATYALVGVIECFGLGEQVRSIAFIRQRSATVDVLERVDVVKSRITDPDGHHGAIKPLTMPDRQFCIARPP